MNAERHPGTRCDICRARRDSHIDAGHGFFARQDLHDDIAQLTAELAATRKLADEYLQERDADRALRDKAQRERAEARRERDEIQRQYDERETAYWDDRRAEERTLEAERAAHAATRAELETWKVRENAAAIAYDTMKAARARVEHERDAMREEIARLQWESDERLREINRLNLCLTKETERATKAEGENFMVNYRRAKAVAALQHVAERAKFHQRDIGHHLDDMMAPVNAVLADPTCTQAGEAWRELEAVYEATSAYRKAVLSGEGTATFADVRKALAAVDARRGGGR